jgi:alpha-beta hydrolase superfamily lysophospholipase
MRTELVSIATDTVPLDGAFHWPEDRPSRGGVLLFHGNTMNFYIGAPRWLPPVLTELGFACLAFNRRGHDILSIRFPCARRRRPAAHARSHCRQ